MYATVNDMVAQLGRDEVVSLSDRVGRGEMNEVLVQDALIRASAQMDSYLSTRYVVPLSTVPAVVRSYCVDIAYYLLCRGSRVLNEDIQGFYDQAVKWLRDVAAGRASLGLPSSVAPSVADEVVLFTPVSAGRLAGWVDGAGGAGDHGGDGDGA